MKLDSNKAQVYLAYGLTMNSVQECELTLIQTYYAIKLIKGKVPTEDAKTLIYSKGLEKTFKKLVESIESQNYFKQKIIDKLYKINDLRNNLAHTFFKEFLKDLESEAGRKNVISGLKFSDQYIKDVCSELTIEVKKIFKDLNFTDEEIELFTNNNTRYWIEYNKA